MNTQIGSGPFESILADLARLCSQGATGSFFLVSDHKHLASFVLEEGVIRSVQYGAVLGRKAFPLIAAIRQGSYKFKPNETLIQREMILPDTRQIIDFLRRQHVGSDTPQASVDVPDIPPPSAAQREEIEAVLINILGPMGSFYADQLEEMSSIDELLGNLREDVSDERLMERLSQALKAIG